MKNSIAIAIILFLAMLNLIPPLFAHGGVFDASMRIVNDCNQIVVIHGLYFDNAYYTLLFITLSFISLVMPVLAPKLPKAVRITSLILAGWFTSGLTFELMNWFIPEITLNTMFDRSGLNRCLLALILSISIIFIHKQWLQIKRN